ncbi:aromatic ring-hydroxylating oxygenase subunit alpha [Nocardia sp. alder85J]|uniref:aromatic ring-hydroxylating oxygenase subunit alpha n=1 Tax=Nocardia sp. alder85J TaxID=2862949 RepID=UPI001CD4692C|nr:aromatic ring-hydroxylating dioxygenase subunit alpha [Nocardia sp. alder85J]MCX4097022.1 aromatic ring-hydroxylating dioxygenase subunit alpha [Nocardia sp. alder85J]
MTTAAQPQTGNRIAAGPLAEPPSGRSLLPARAYTGTPEFEAEQHLVFATGWVWAGYAHWLAVPGAVHPVTVAGQPLLLVRDEQDRIRVFHNSCRHRGMTLTEEPTVVRKRIQCAYHCWSFALDGTLCAAPYYGRSKGSAVDPELGERLRLLPVAAQVWAGLVFVNLAATETDPEVCAAEFTAQLRPLLDRWSHIDFDRLHLVEERRFDIEANWKLVVENFLDFYHLPFIHPQVGPVAASLDIDDLVLRPDIVGGSYPRGAVGKADKTERRLPWLGDVPADRTERQDIFCVFPNALLFLEADWFQVIGFDPLAPDRTVEHMAVFVDRTAAAAEYTATRTQLARALFAVNEQDLPILRRLQAGRHSPAADATNLVAAWDQITALFQQRVADRAGYR